MPLLSLSFSLPLVADISKAAAARNLSSGGRFSHVILLRLHFLPPPRNPRRSRTYPPTLRRRLRLHREGVPHPVTKSNPTEVSRRSVRFVRSTLSRRELKTASSPVLGAIVDWRSREFYWRRNDPLHPFHDLSPPLPDS